jgi:hypothetical protein
MGILICIGGSDSGGLQGDRDRGLWAQVPKPDLSRANERW